MKTLFFLVIASCVAYIWAIDNADVAIFYPQEFDERRALWLIIACMAGILVYEKWDKK